MTDLSDRLQPDTGQAATTIHLVDEKSFAEWRKGQSPAIRNLLDARRYDGKSGYASMILPGENDEDWSVVSTVANVDELSPWCLSKLGEVLPAGTYRLANDLEPGPAKLGWLLGQHRFDRYLSQKPEDAGPRVLLTGKAARIDRTVALAEATIMVRDLINTTAEDLGPADLQRAIEELANEYKAEVTTHMGDGFADEYPMIYAVGKAAAEGREPRLVELEWGNKDHPRLAIVGKGVVFDSGGLDIKGAKGMRIMKKDMGGAAHAIALASLVMKLGLKVRLHLLIPTVENAIDGRALRPGDVIDSRKGISVEIDNTDAEGRLILGDALAKAGEDEAGLIIDYATLTGAARVALGPDLPPMFVNDDELAGALEEGAKAEGDPVWRMPLWDGYDKMLKSDIADMANSASSAFAGCITAALFLRKFVPAETPWVHFDTYGWSPSTQPGRPKGGEAYGLRAAWAMLEERYGL
ncbi:leucyl aminopeptidase family protein [Sphingomicrobium clamense]|uniref:Leucyl aminopeptidase family protein n=1 Tax=Sphingomicrobium clamense TaxID=2851013 RepID=A0ABS6V602_9SPHN|nr:leucyl aminopeptidase family protein [Sphingomicrobium sp. B8]MBW0144785.1 leucyl aminopeptidase family protein [Sphingomicrobium sp. B8]